MAALIYEKSLILYIATQENSVGVLTAQENNEEKNALYYIIRMVTPNKLNYSLVEKLYLTIIFTIPRLKHYFQARSVRLISKTNPIKYVMSRLVLSDCLARWYFQL